MDDLRRPYSLCWLQAHAWPSLPYACERERACRTSVHCSFGSTLLELVWPECAEAGGVGQGTFARTLTWSGPQGVSGRAERSGVDPRPVSSSGPRPGMWQVPGPVPIPRCRLPEMVSPAPAGGPAPRSPAEALLDTPLLLAPAARACPGCAHCPPSNPSAQPWPPSGKDAQHVTPKVWPPLPIQLTSLHLAIPGKSPVVFTLDLFLSIVMSSLRMSDPFFPGGP